jgi:hypothetical protein
MTKTITLDYEEFEDLKEKANLNQSAMDKRVLKRINQLYKDMERQYKGYKNDELRDRLIRSIKSGVNRRINSFGYVKGQDIVDLLETYG